MSLMYHVVSAADWARADGQPAYEAASLSTEGFIHLATAPQVAGVLGRYYAGVPDLMLLHVDTDRLTAELRYEPATDNALFPHLYGPLNRDAVIGVEAITEVHRQPV